MKKPIIAVVAFAVVVAGMTFAVNYVQLQRPMDEAITNDSRNIGIDVSVHFSNYVNPSTLIYDLRRVSGSNSASDVFRVLLQFADRIQGKQFTIVELAYKGRTKFKLDGSYFQTLGEEYGSQNPVYTMRTFPEHLRTPTGNVAYGEWTGGLLGVLNKQLEDFNDFHKQWYLSEH